jgi:hypothetical protein
MPAFMSGRVAVLGGLRLAILSLRPWIARTRGGRPTIGQRGCWSLIGVRCLFVRCLASEADLNASNVFFIRVRVDGGTAFALVRDMAQLTRDVLHVVRRERRR